MPPDRSAPPPATPAKARGSQARRRFRALHEELRRRICRLDYPPGTKLAEEQLAAEFGVSRTPVRRVLCHLEAEGLVDSRHGVGTVVTDPDLDHLRQIYALRMRLAELMGELDPEPPDATRLERLRTILRRLDALAADPDPRSADYAAINMSFHQALMRSVGNRALRETADRLYYQTARLFLQAVPRVDLQDEIAIFRREVADILAAMLRGDMRAVGFIRRNHIAMSFDRLVSTTTVAAEREVAHAG
jgi:DNA-binding GntR family transcriptional regulator